MDGPDCDIPAIDGRWNANSMLCGHMVSWGSIMFHSDIGVSGKQAEKRRTYGGPFTRTYGSLFTRTYGSPFTRTDGSPFPRAIGATPQNSVCRTLVDLLTEDEKVVMGCAIRMFCGLQYREQNLDTADDEWYEDCISDELEEIAPLYEKPEYKNDSIHTLRFTQSSLMATEEGREPSIANVNLADVFPLCDEGAIKHPSWNTQLNMKNLDALVGLQDHKHRWWLPATWSGVVAASHATPSAVVGPSASVRDAPTVNEDVEMADDNGGVTPKKKKAGKRPAVQSPTPAPRADSGDAIRLPLPESGSGGLKPAKPPPCPVSSEDEVKAPIPRRKRKRHDSTLVDDSASELETGLTDPGACGPCKASHHKCKPQVSTKGLTCRLCIKRKIKCDPPSAVSQAIINARKKKHSNEDIVERLDITARSQEEFNTAVRDFMFNTDTVLRALCTHGQGKVNLASLGLRLPAVPRFSEAEPSTPGASSVTSGVSSLGLSRMMVDNAGVAGPSEPQPEYGDTERNFPPGSSSPRVTQRDVQQGSVEGRVTAIISGVANDPLSYNTHVVYYRVPEYTKPVGTHLASPKCGALSAAVATHTRTTPNQGGDSIRLYGRERIRLDGLKSSRFDGRESSRLDGRESIRLDGHESIRLDGPFRRTV
ncbi:hypothetical protein EDB85DRAFT_1904663 [Lactarius pseudohatsudake]|nr:hypothetical protein EDB85DRAFT_1904663 [Lactarius pseudohatsudake]